MDISLSTKSREIISKRLGLNFEEIISMDAEDIDRIVESKIKKKLEPKPIKDERLINRGSVYLYLRRFIDFRTKKYDSYIDKLKTV
jgi:hypothetical protein